MAEFLTVREICELLQIGDRAAYERTPPWHRAAASPLDRHPHVRGPPQTPRPMLLLAAFQIRGNPAFVAVEGGCQDPMTLGVRRCSVVPAEPPCSAGPAWHQEVESPVAARGIRATLPLLFQRLHLNKLYKLAGLEIAIKQDKHPSS